MNKSLKIIFSSFGIVSATAVVATTAISCGKDSTDKNDKTPTTTLFNNQNLRPIIQQEIAKKLNIAVKDLPALTFKIGNTDNTDTNKPTILVTGSLLLDKQAITFSTNVSYNYTLKSYIIFGTTESIKWIGTTSKIETPTAETLPFDDSYITEPQYHNRAYKNQALFNEIFKATKININANILYDFTKVSAIKFDNDDLSKVTTGSAMFTGHSNSNLVENIANTIGSPTPFMLKITYNYKTNKYRH